MPSMSQITDELLRQRGNALRSKRRRFQRRLANFKALTGPTIPTGPSGDGSMDFSLPGGDNTGLLVLLEDI